MSTAMVRGVIAGALAFLATGLAQPQPLDAAAKSGGAKYQAPWPNTGTSPWDVSVSPSGDVTGSYRQTSNVTFTPQYGGGGPFRVHFTNTGTMTGTLADGVLTISGTQTRAASSKESSSYNYEYVLEFAYTATVSPDADGNLLGTANTGETFTWWRR